MLAGKCVLAPSFALLPAYSEAHLAISREVSITQDLPNSFWRKNTLTVSRSTPAISATRLTVGRNGKSSVSGTGSEGFADCKEQLSYFSSIDVSNS
jgi:hypothetical protein